MVVSGDNGIRVAENRWLEHFSRVGDRLGEVTPRDFVESIHPMFRGEAENDEHFHGLVLENRSKEGGPLHAVRSRRACRRSGGDLHGHGIRLGVLGRAWRFLPPCGDKVSRR